MADWDGILLEIVDDPRTADPFVIIPIAEIIIDAEDAADYADSYEETEGCTP